MKKSFILEVASSNVGILVWVPRFSTIKDETEEKISLDGVEISQSPTLLDIAETPLQNHVVATQIDGDIGSLEISPEIKEIPDRPEISSSLNLQNDIVKYCLEDSESKECLEATAKLKEIKKISPQKTPQVEQKLKIGDAMPNVKKLDNIGEISINTKKQEISDSAATEAFNKLRDAKAELFSDSKNIKKRRSFSRPKLKENSDE